MSKSHNITEAELYVMKELWKNSPLTSSQIIEVLRPETQWNPKTIHTLISRLVSKGNVGVNKNAPQHLYYPIVSETEYKSVQTKSFIDKVYDGSVHHLIVNFIKEEKLSSDELDELRQLLNDKEKERG